MEAAVEIINGLDRAICVNMASDGGLVFFLCHHTVDTWWLSVSSQLSDGFGLVPYEF